ncbi:MAG: M3 family oligoendopeptidase [Spirochaetaceae bacterium]|jgi:pepF/M3 family oligoendopeptidase|nr:M3 family oligoendopeptidase [Spirochaetaceae bacterium]
MIKQHLPNWDLHSIYPSFESNQYKQDKCLLTDHIKNFEKLLTETATISSEWLLKLIHVFEAASNTAENLSSYCNAIYTVNTRDNVALAQINEVDMLELPLKKLIVIFRAFLAKHKEDILRLIHNDEALVRYEFFIQESIDKASYQMNEEMEDLANDLARSGADAWARLHNGMSSTANIIWDDNTGERKTVIALRDLAHSEDRIVRKRAYTAELAAWKSVEIPIAAALNGIKGYAISLDKRRGWQSVFQKSSSQSRISEKTLFTLIHTLEKSLPVFRTYLNAKAKFLGIKKCAFYDLFAPVQTGNKSFKRWNWQDATSFITARFSDFDPLMAEFARKVFDSSWIDAEGHEGKIGGAYCVDFPLAGESRILCNFEGSFDSVTTVAHETGHAWHSAVTRDLPRFQSLYPMTLAETASIFAETIVFEGALEQSDDEERITLIEGSIKDACQVIVDILSRFYFEKELFERRKTAELTPEELCEIMLNAQKKTYGDGLDEKELHPYMWAVKTHYYNYALPFYNYPYAFGQLFALSLYSRAKAEGPSFAKAYRDLLQNTGRMSAENVAVQAGFDIRHEDFWQQGVAVITERIGRFVKAAGLIPDENK